MNVPEVRIVAVDDPGRAAALSEDFARLIPQLSQSSPPPDAVTLTEIIENPNSVLFIAEDDEAVLGSLTLAFFRTPTALKAWIEDVVVDDAARGRGVGEALTQSAVGEAKRRGAKAVDLTSRPSREAANRLYQRVGFQERQTNVYRLSL